MTRVGYWRTEALCLRVTPWRETSYVVSWFTPTEGRIAAVAKGARRPGSRLRGEIDVLTRADLVLHRRKGSTALHTLCEVEVRERFRTSRSERRRLVAALYVLEWLRELAAEADPAPGLYALATRALERIEHRPRYTPLTAIIFGWLALAERGIGPRLEACVECGAPLPEGPRTPFVPAAGGVCCRACARAATARLELPSGLLRRWREVLARPESVAGLELAPAELHAAQDAIDACVEAHRGRPLRLARHLRATFDERDPERAPADTMPSSG